VRDEEYNRLVSYAKGLGVKITKKPYVPGSGDGAEWDAEGKEITLYVWPRQSKTKLVLNLIHELAHHLGWIYKNRKLTVAEDKALQWESDRKPTETLPIEKRKIYYENEVKDYRFRKKIIKEVDIKIPRWKLELDIRFDKAVYYYYYQKGNFPTEKIKAKWRRELTAKMRKKFPDV
jgi:hypothetical protein